MKVTKMIRCQLNVSHSLTESIALSIIENEKEFAEPLFSKHDIEDQRYQFADQSLVVDNVHVDAEQPVGYADIRYGIHFFWPCNNQDEIDMYEEIIYFELDRDVAVFKLDIHEPWIVS
ncbi:hypothetical protein [Photobacterium damselae]|uniref:hypothetical protein n=1 Tax=Photobacterium damselae TaxID=38293 RepID=UPI00083A2869|nr:hypothetical protein [Photobacterium damselae]